MIEGFYIVLMLKRKLSAFLFLLVLGNSSAFAQQEYSPQNPYTPTAQQIKHLQQIIPAFPERPPMQDYTALYKEKFIISDYPPGMFKYYVHIPENYTPEKSYPTVLMLHGGARHMYGGRNYFELGLQKEYPAILIVPIAPPGYDWNSGAPLALEALQDVAKSYRLDPKRIYLTGYSMGGIGVYSMLARYHKIFAGAFAVCGTYDPQKVEGFDDVPLLIYHAQKDETFPVQVTRDMHARLKSAKRNVAYIEQEDANHFDCASVYEKKGFWDWIFEQKK